MWKRKADGGLETSEDRRKCRKDLKYERDLTHNCWPRRWRKLATNQGMWVAMEAGNPLADSQKENRELSPVTVRN